MAKPVVHFEIAGSNGDRTREFYGKLFGWEYQVFGADGDYGLVGPGAEKAIGGGVCGAPAGAPPYLTFYVQVEDLATELARAEELGGKTVLPPTPIPGQGSCAMFADLDGNVVGLYSTATEID